MLIIPQIASFGIERLNLSYGSSSTLVMVVNGAGLPARIFVPMLADRVGALNVITCCVLTAAIVLFCWFAVSDIPGLYAFTAAFGLASGAIQSLIPTTIASITKRLDTVGTRLGMCFSVLSIASLTGPPVGGALQSSSGSYIGPQVWAAVSTLVGSLLLVFSRTLRTGGKLKAKC